MTQLYTYTELQKKHLDLQDRYIHSLKEYVEVKTELDQLKIDHKDLSERMGIVIED